MMYSSPLRFVFPDAVYDNNDKYRDHQNDQRPPNLHDKTNRQPDKKGTENQ